VIVKGIAGQYRDDCVIELATTSDVCSFSCTTSLESSNLPVDAFVCVFVMQIPALDESGFIPFGTHPKGTNKYIHDAISHILPQMPIHDEQKLVSKPKHLKSSQQSACLLADMGSGVA